MRHDQDIFAGIMREDQVHDLVFTVPDHLLPGYIRIGIGCPGKRGRV